MDCHSELNPTATPCFLESFKGRLEGRLNESQYLNHILKHFCGVKHQADFEDAVRITTVHNYLRRYDRVGENINAQRYLQTILHFKVHSISCAGYPFIDTVTHYRFASLGKNLQVCLY